MKTAAVIVAAGKGLRLGGPVPKQYRLLGGEMILTRTLRAFLGSSVSGPIAVAIHPDAKDLFAAAVAVLEGAERVFPVDGGAERSDSVRRALETLEPHAPDRVLIHDAARPFVSTEALNDLCNAPGGAILAERVVDALWHETGSAEQPMADRPTPRAGLWRAQTPQAFPFSKILAAHRLAASSEGPPALDDAEVFRRAGYEVSLVQGEPDNFKITTEPDLARAERMVAAVPGRGGASGRAGGGGGGPAAITTPVEAVQGERAMETRIGQGFDVHRFTDGDAVWLCGVNIPHTHRLEGHSDADVGLHALADAIYGALSEGDIGTHFPPSDPQWKGAESQVFLDHAAKLVRDRGGRIVNTDLTLLCEAPKILPHAQAMRARLSEIMEIDAARISIKATTMERMGFVGREEGMGCMAVAAIELPSI
ncbi:MAG: 2-C-methyl-D-erythritol 2,4-cyclodiphosphate synthase [Pseudomonadota bacterium]